MDLTPRTSWIVGDGGIKIIQPIFKINTAPESYNDGSLFGEIGSKTLDVGRRAEE